MSLLFLSRRLATRCGSRSYHRSARPSPHQPYFHYSYSRRLFSNNHSSSHQPPPPSIFQRLRNLWDRGTLLIFLGGTGLSLLVVDRALQYWDARDARNMIGIIQDEQRQQQEQLWQKYKDAPVLFECIVKKQYAMGGTHGLPNVQLNQTIQVLEEGVGPDKYYNLCRTSREEEDGSTKVAVGWYPMSYLEKKQRGGILGKVLGW